MKNSDLIIFILMGLFSVTMVVLLILLMLHSSMFNNQREEACAKLGYNSYDYENKVCVGKGKYLPVYMICEKTFLNPSCKAIPIDKLKEANE